MKREQYVCLVCGFNMIGFYPDHCPFCGAAKKHFITAEKTNRIALGQLFSSPEVLAPTQSSACCSLVLKPFTDLVVNLVVIDFVVRDRLRLSKEWSVLS